MIERKQTSIGSAAAVALSETKWWVGKTPREVACFQTATKELCMPFAEFHQAVEAAIGRSVWTHEFARNFDGIYAELFDGAAAPSFDDIVALIPADKRVVVSL